VLTASLIIGVAVSLLLVEIVGLSAGGVITPGYVALLLDRPAALAGFLAAALATFGCVRLMSEHLMLFGQRRFAVALLIGMAFSVGARFLSPAFAAVHLEWAGLGFIVPGLMAHQFDRQGILQTLVMLAIAAPLTRAIVMLVLGFSS
jgi:poly-gamma-glutamate biosynthesis protein PgsC/CapC